jgi:hypothetical protein
MWAVAGAVGPQALAIALSPVPLVFCFALGWYAALAIGVGLAVALTDLAAEENEESVREGVDYLLLAVGALFAILAIRYWRKRPAPGEPAPRPAIFDRILGLSPPALVLTGAGAALANVKNLPLILSAGTYIGAAGLSAASTTAAAAIFVTIASLTVLLPLPVVLLIRPERAAPALKSFETWLLTNLNAITAFILAALALILVVQSLAYTA